MSAVAQAFAVSYAQARQKFLAAAAGAGLLGVAVLYIHGLNPYGFSPPAQHRHPEAAPELAAQIRNQVKESFFTDTDEWKEQVLRQTREALFQAADGLGA